MATELKMPQMGYDMEEGTVVRWLKEEGSAVNRNEAVAEIETDKAIVEFESDSEGVLLKIIAPEGTVVPVGQTIAVIGDEGEETDNISILDLRPPEEGKSDPTKNATPPTEPQESTPALSVTKEASEVSTGRILSTPIARRMAEERNIDLSYISGSGPGGRITKNDVENYKPDNSNVEKPAEPSISVAPTSTTIVVSNTDSHSETSEKQPISKMRQQIARVTVKSKTEKPHFYVSADINMTNAMSIRKQINEQLKDDGVRLTVNDLIVKACIQALTKYPKFNAYYEEDGIQYNDKINIAVAIAEEEGLIVPAILDCGEKSLRQVSQMIKDLADRSSNGTLSPQEYSGGTFAISNLGMFDVSSFVAIIHPPQSAVLAVGTVSEKPIVTDGEITVGQVMTATISADHRIVDGAEGAQFLIEVKRLLQSPTSLLV
ncbi:MAG: 2-oxo acid dehydrogenase subunit E2 [Dehalococcoidia bacterium]|uniref:Dihydrolipoamide acetyltransferase component of pyruvate dehydrogenase complex n=1 Tax=marine metagenome TaxID=408172 RepID=A0A381V148_9ZZZZ|nr:2-oxo acid dehydrogenase subunit E2 [Dehalococcoidia bacterium]MEC7913820.1 dihydrolipoamide acetyltransferase family protein [Chloroflexota bacterium]|tara:strand:+ start:4668 stop:5963 length:1296 start_codon:yes stop_codon:yes gene_type:complete